MRKNPITAKFALQSLAKTRFGVISGLLLLIATEPRAEGSDPDAVAAIAGGMNVFDVRGCVNGIQAYSAEGGVCNLGDAALPGNIGSNHPMWTSNLYRLVSNVNTNRFEQIGMSWVKHDDWSSDEGYCFACVPPIYCDLEHILQGVLDPG